MENGGDGYPGENGGDGYAMAKVMGMSELVEKIILHVGSSVGTFRCRAVHPSWRDVTMASSFSNRFAEMARRGNLGFLVDLKHGGLKKTKLLHPDPSDDDAANFFRAKIDTAVLAEEKVVDCIDGTVLTKGGQNGTRRNKLYTSCLWHNPRVYTEVATRMPKIPRNMGQHTVNTFGQFGVLPDAGRSGMTFFVKDVVNLHFSSYAGVTFCSGEDIYVHVSVYTAGHWDRYVSNPMPSPDAALFHSFPYSILDGDRVYLMYVVGYVVCFDVGSKTFSKIPLPPNVGVKPESSCSDYRVAARSGGGLVLVNCSHGMLQKWSLNTNLPGADWEPVISKELMVLFGAILPTNVWNNVILRDTWPIATDNTFSVQIRAASDDASWLLLTLGFVNDLYEVNMEKDTARLINNTDTSGSVGKIFHVAEPWPPAI